jgi:hypothetical protein
MKTINERDNDVQKALDTYEVKIGLPIAFPPGDEMELQEYFNYNRTDIEALTATQCSAIASRLFAFAFYIRRMFNREAAISRWADDAINDIVSKEIQNYAHIFAKHEVKVCMMQKESVPLQELFRLQSQAKQRMSRLDGLADSLQSLGRSFENNQRAKSFENRQ